MPIKSFRGNIADGSVDTISLHTNTGAIGYRIKNFQIITTNPSAGSDYASIVKIYKIPQTTVDGVVDFSDNTLLAAAYYALNDAAYYGQDKVTIFDNMIFNQDIYVTHKDVAVGQTVNYYIELEQIKLDLNENTVATLKDIRNIEAQ